MPAKEGIRSRNRTQDESTMSTKSVFGKKIEEFEDVNVIDRVPTAFDYQSDGSEEEWLEEKSKGSRYSMNKANARIQSLLSDGDDGNDGDDGDDGDDGNDGESNADYRDDKVEKDEEGYDKYSKTNLLDATIDRIWSGSIDDDTHRYAGKGYLGSLFGTGDNFERSKLSKKMKKMSVIHTENEEVMEPIYESPKKNKIKTNQSNSKDKSLVVQPINVVAPRLAKKPTDEVSTAPDYGSVTSSLTDPLENMLKNSEDPNKLVKEFEERLKVLKAMAASKSVEESARSPSNQRTDIVNETKTSSKNKKSNESTSPRSPRSGSGRTRSKSSSPSSKRRSRSKSSRSHCSRKSMSSRSRSSHRSKSSRSKGSKAKSKSSSKKSSKSKSSSKKSSKSDRLPDLIGSPSDAVYSNAATRKQSNAKHKKHSQKDTKISSSMKLKKIEEAGNKSPSSTRRKSRSNSGDRRRSRSHSRSSSKATDRSKSSLKKERVKNKSMHDSSRSPSSRRSKHRSSHRSKERSRSGSRKRDTSKKSSKNKFKGSKYLKDNDLKDESVERARYELTREMIDLIEKVSNAKKRNDSDSSEAPSKRKGKSKQTGVIRKRKDVMKNFSNFFRRTRNEEEIIIARTEDYDERKINKNESEPVTINTRSMTTDDGTEGPLSSKSRNENISPTFAERQEMVENILANSHNKISPRKSSPLGRLLHGKESTGDVVESKKEANRIEQEILTDRKNQDQRKGSVETTRLKEKWKAEIEASEEKWLFDKRDVEEKKSAIKKAAEDINKSEVATQMVEARLSEDEMRSRTAIMKKTAASKKKKRKEKEKELERQKENEKEFERQKEKEQELEEQKEKETELERQKQKELERQKKKMEKELEKEKEKEHEKKKKKDKEKKKNRKKKKHDKKNKQKEELVNETMPEWDEVSDEVVKALASIEEEPIEPYPTLSYKSRERSTSDSGSKVSKTKRAAATKQEHLVIKSNPLDLDEYSLTLPSYEPGLVQCMRFYSCGSAANAVNVAIQVSECDQCNPPEPIRIKNDDYEDAILDSRSITESATKRNYRTPSSPMPTVEVVLEDEDQSKPSILTRIRSVEPGMLSPGDDDDDSTDDGYYLKEAPTLRLPHVNSYVLDVSRMQLHLDEDSVERRQREADRRSYGAAEDRSTITITSVHIPPRHVKSEDEDETEEEDDDEEKENGDDSSDEVSVKTDSNILEQNQNEDAEDKNKAQTKRNRVLQIFARFRKRDRANKGGLFEA